MGHEFNAFSRAKEEAKDIYELIEQEQNEYIAKTYLTRQPDGAVRPDNANIKLYERAINVKKENLLGRTLRLNQVWNKEGGFALSTLFEYKDENAYVKGQKVIEKHFKENDNFFKKITVKRLTTRTLNLLDYNY